MISMTNDIEVITDEDKANENANSLNEDSRTYGMKINLDNAKSDDVGLSGQELESSSGIFVYLGSTMAATTKSEREIQLALPGSGTSTV